MLLTSKATAWYSNGELLFISVANIGGIISCNVHVINMRRTIRKNQIANVITLFLDNEEYKPYHNRRQKFRKLRYCMGRDA